MSVYMVVYVSYMYDQLQIRVDRLQQMILYPPHQSNFATTIPPSPIPFIPSNWKIPRSLGVKPGTLASALMLAVPCL